MIKTGKIFRLFSFASDMSLCYSAQAMEWRYDGEGNVLGKEWGRS